MDLVQCQQKTPEDGKTVTTAATESWCEEAAWYLDTVKTWPAAGAQTQTGFLPLTKMLSS